jgi:hypothetical protein
MLYYAFDLDHTLGDFGYLHVFLDYLKLANAFLVRGELPLSPISKELQTLLNETYDIFIAQVLEADKAGLGLINPPMYSLFQELADLMDINKVGPCVIYSNNSDFSKLQFAKDILEADVERSLFCNLLDWNHRSRTHEIVKGQPGMADKTWAVLRRAFLDGQCFATPDSVTPEHVFFFDDLRHPNLVETLPKENYIQVTAYYSKPDWAPVAKALEDAANATELFQNAEYLGHISQIQGKPMTGEKIVEELRQFVERMQTRAKGGGKTRRSKPKKKTRKSFRRIA